MANSLLAKLRNAGMVLSREGDQLVVVPRHRLDDDLRAAIRNGKTELLAALADEQISRSDNGDDLEARILAMAKRWGFSLEELAEELAGAATDRARSLLWVKHDEVRFGNAETPNAKH
jgi:hypothetical protein